MSKIKSYSCCFEYKSDNFNSKGTYDGGRVFFSLSRDHFTFLNELVEIYSMLDIDLKNDSKKQSFQYPL